MVYHSSKGGLGTPSGVYKIGEIYLTPDSGVKTPAAAKLPKKTTSY